MEWLTKMELTMKIIVIFDPNAVCAVRRENGADWPHDTIAQHETSHLFNAPDHGYYCQVCIMCYTWAYAGTDIWCPEVCKPVIDGNINYQG